MLDIKKAKRNIEKIIMMLKSYDLNVIFNPINDTAVGIENRKEQTLDNNIIIRSIIDSKIMIIQPFLSRGDRRVGKILYEAYINGDSENAWNKALKNSKIPNNIYLNEKPISYKFPWEFINHGINRKYLENEWKLSQKGLLSPPCSNRCSRCGLCKNQININEKKCQKNIAIN